MRCAIRVLLLAGLVFAPAAAQADNILPGENIIVLNNLSTFGQGGPFTVDDQTLGDADFVTFCLERNEYFTPGSPVTVHSISDEAKLGGLSGNTGTGDPLGKLTAFLYANFRAGNNFGYSAPVFQEAIWNLEGEWPFHSGEVLSANASALIAAAGAAMASNLVWNSAGPTYIGNVQVMNLRVGTELKQDMLMITGPDNSIPEVPEPTSLVLLGTGLFAAAAAARRRGKK